jgi:hypothetical protein
MTARREKKRGLLRQRGGINRKSPRGYSAMSDCDYEPVICALVTPPMSGPR